MADFFVHPSSFIDGQVAIGTGTHIWHFCHIMENAQIGERCNIGQNVMIGKNVHIGNRVKIQNNVSIYEMVSCEDDVFVGPSVVFTNVINPRSFIERKHQFLPTLVQKGATIGANATIICGHTIGQYALIGAGSVLTKDAPAFALMVGNPAQQIGWVSKAGHRLNFEKDTIAICPETKEKYELQNNQVQWLAD